MDQPVGHIIQLRLYPIRRFWSLGSGWAAIGGSLAVAGFVLSPEFLLYLFLVWLLADPILGAVWDLGAGHTFRLGHRGIWRRLLSPRLPDVAPPVRLLPYTQPGSPGYRLASRLGRMRLWWHDTLWPEAGQEFATLIAALGIAGMRCSTVVDGAVNGDVFEAFVEQVLVPELRSGDVVIMDNLSSHKRQRIRALIEAAGARLVFLPPYSPDLNPIEMIFAKVKQLLRSLACRTRDALWHAMQSVLDQVTPEDAVNCYKHCGYTLQMD